MKCPHHERCEILPGGEHRIYANPPTRTLEGKIEKVALQVTVRQPGFYWIRVAKGMRAAIGNEDRWVIGEYQTDSGIAQVFVCGWDDSLDPAADIAEWGPRMRAPDVSLRDILRESVEDAASTGFADPEALVKVTLSEASTPQTAAIASAVVAESVRLAEAERDRLMAAWKSSDDESRGDIESIANKIIAAIKR